MSKIAELILWKRWRENLRGADIPKVAIANALRWPTLERWPTTKGWSNLSFLQVWAKQRMCYSRVCQSLGICKGSFWPCVHSPFLVSMIGQYSNRKLVAWANLASPTAQICFQIYQRGSLMHWPHSAGASQRYPWSASSTGTQTPYGACPRSWSWGRSWLQAPDRIAPTHQEFKIWRTTAESTLEVCSNFQSANPDYLTWLPGPRSQAEATFEPMVKFSPPWP